MSCNKYEVKFSFEVRKHGKYGTEMTGFDLEVREPVPLGVDPIPYLRDRITGEIDRYAESTSGFAVLTAYSAQEELPG